MFQNVRRNSIDDEDYEVLYVTGKNSYEEFKKNKFSHNVFVEPYIENLSGLTSESSFHDLFSFCAFIIH